MTSIKITIDNKCINLPAGTTILAGAKLANKYIPTLCNHPNLPLACLETPSDKVFQGKNKIRNNLENKKAKQCGLCLVEIEGEKDLFHSCQTEAKEGMIIYSNNEKIQKERKKNLIPILSRHKHACITCSQQEGCSQTQCSSNVQEIERCCAKFNNCEFKNIIQYIGIPKDTPKWKVSNIPLINNEPLINIDYNLCIGCIRCVRVCNKIRKVGAINFVWDKEKKIRVGTINNTLSSSKCKFCTACIEVCPTGALQDKILKTSSEKIKKIVPCKASCPMEINIPDFLRMVAIGNFNEAFKIVKEKIPFPRILGRICMHPCESKCRRGQINSPIAICSLKKFISDNQETKIRINTYATEKSNRNIAIIGSGPAGLSAAFFLSQKGHSVTIYDSENKPGGMLRYAIPKYRLPKHIVDLEINEILNLGINFKPNKKLGTNLNIKKIFQNGADAVLIAIGAQSDRTISIKNCNTTGVIGAIKFLKAIANKEKIKLGQNTIVIGGGNVAIDVAMSALRCGSKKVGIICLESEDEMPANEWEIKTAKAEGITIYPSLAPNEIIRKNGIVREISVIKCNSVFNSNGNFSPKCDETIEQKIPTDQIIIAAGQKVNLNCLTTTNIVTKHGLISVDKKTLETSYINVYAAGDAISLPGSVIKAIASGKKAAENINKALGFKQKSKGISNKKYFPNATIGKNENFVEWTREIEPEANIKIIKNNFEEVIGKFTKEQALREAKRCLQCDLRLFLSSNLTPPKKSLRLTIENINYYIPKETEGVYKLLDENKKTSSIVGTQTIRNELLSALTKNKAIYFEFEEDKMYSQRESELIQKHLQKYGKMPGGIDEDLDDLF